MSNTTEISALEKYSLQPAATSTKKDELGQDAFMKLMLTQLQNQDPFKPTENGEFIAQMAQFSTVTGISEMQGSLDKLAGSFGNYQTLQSASLVGRSVMIPSDKFTLNSENTIEGLYETDTTGPATANIYNSAGELIHQIDLGIVSDGTHEFSWDGLLEDGSRAATAQYTLGVVYGSGEFSAAAEIKMKKEIVSVNFSTSNGETILNTDDGLSLTLSQISQIQ